MQQKAFKIIKEVWPKFLIFTVMLCIVIFQKDPTKVMSVNQDIESVNQQFKTGEFEDTPFETGPFRQEAIRNFVFAGVLFAIFLILRNSNDKADHKKYLEKLEKERLEREKEEDEINKDVDTYKKWKKKKKFD